MKKIAWTATAILLVAGIVVAAGSSRAHQDWHSASRDSARIAPAPQEETRAVVQAYAAPVFGWRGIFADHTWIATKPTDGDSYTVFEALGWRLRRGLSVTRIARDIPDRLWFGAKPRLLLDLRGEKAAALIGKIESAARNYPWPDKYRAFPGPNSNTFIAWIAREAPELDLHLPWRAVGRSYPLPRP